MISENNCFFDLFFNIYSFILVEETGFFEVFIKLKNVCGYDVKVEFVDYNKNCII